jgi:hypothetical protein
MVLATWEKGEGSRERGDKGTRRWGDGEQGRQREQREKAYTFFSKP